MGLKAWQIWGEKPKVEETLSQRAQGNLPEMESTKQLVKLVSEHYKPGMRILDGGCNVGHYLVGLRRLDPELNYTGVDAYDSYISQAKEIFANDANAQFDVKSIMEPIFPDQPFDITYSCNVLIHLPNFTDATKSLLESTKDVCIIRTLFSDRTVIVKRAAEENTPLDENGIPTKYIHQNTYDRKVFSDFVDGLGWKVDFVKDEYDASVLDNEHKKLKNQTGTGISNGRQADEYIFFNWEWAVITRK